MLKRIGLALALFVLAVSPAFPQSSVLPYWINSSNVKVATGTGNPLPVTIVGGGGGGLSVTDQASWTQGSSNMTPVGCAYNDAATLTSGQQGTVRCTTKRAAVVDVDTSGNNLYAALTASIPAGTNLIGDVNLRQGGTALSTTNGAYFNQLQGNAVLSATNPSFARLTDGTNAQLIDPCQAVAKTTLAFSQADDAVLISGTAAKKTYICSMKIIAGAAEIYSILSGTGSVCGTGTTVLAGSSTQANGLSLAANGGDVYGTGGFSVLVTGANADDLCLTQSGTNRLAGTLTYVKL